MSNYFTDHQTFYIDSSQRLTGTDSDFSYQLNIDKNINYDRVVLLNCSIPKSYYLVQVGYNTFQLQEGISTVTISMPVGNYTRTSFKNVLTTLLNSSSPNGYTYTITSQNMQNTQDTGLYTYNVSGNGAVQPSFIFTTNLYEQFGFNANSTNTFVTNRLVSKNIINLQIETTLFIRSDICQNMNDNILQDITANQYADYSAIPWSSDKPREYSKVFSKGTANVFYFKLTDENGITINLNGLNLVMNVMVYKLNRIDEAILAYIKYKLVKEHDQEYIKEIEQGDF